MTAATVRRAEMALGVWLCISAFVWRHDLFHLVNAAVVGVLVAVVAYVAIRRPALRYANSALSVWLVATSWLWPPLSLATMTNHLIVGGLVLLLSLPALISTRPTEASQVSDVRHRRRAM